MHSCLVPSGEASACLLSYKKKNMICYLRNHVLTFYTKLLNIGQDRQFLNVKIDIRCQLAIK